MTRSGAARLARRARPALLAALVTVAAVAAPGPGSRLAPATATTVTPPARSDGGLLFGPATVVDAQRPEREPVVHVDGKGNEWVTGPWAIARQSSFLHRSTDDGDQFNVVSPVGQRPTPPPGGGDTDVITDDQGFAYFTDMEATVKLEASVSNDGGNSWRKNPVAEATTLDDRQWFAVDDGPTPAAGDNTVFLAFQQLALGGFIYSTPGSVGANDPVGGLVYQSSSAGLEPVSGQFFCGRLHFDPVRRNLYYPCAAGDRVEVTVGHVEPGQRAGIAYRRVSVPSAAGSGAVGDGFPGVATDGAGNVYAVWLGSGDHNVYYAASTDGAATWGPPVRVNGGEARSNVWPWAAAGRDGTLAMAWYGSDSAVDSDDMPSWMTDPQGATRFPWFGYAALVSAAAGASPGILQQRFTRKPIHYGQICNLGTQCDASAGDRTMADFFTLALATDGGLRIAYNDTTSQHHAGYPYQVRQLRGPSAFGTLIDRPEPVSPVPDPTGDARFPHYAPTGPGPDFHHLDLTGAGLDFPRPGVVRATMRVATLAPADPPAGKTASFWLVRFQALSVGDRGEEAFRIFYLGAESAGRTPLRFFAGSTSSALGAEDRALQGVLQYPAQRPAQGSAGGATITVEVPLEDGFGDARPILGRTLHNVTALSGGRNGDAPDFYADVDATRSFDLTVPVGTTSAPPALAPDRTAAPRPAPTLPASGGRTGAAVAGGALLVGALLLGRFARRRPAR